MPLKLGDQIPDFSLSDQLGVSRTNKQAKGRPLVLFFYPKDDTPGCTAENCGFRDKYDLFKLFGAEVWGVSGDDEASHRSFADKNDIAAMCYFLCSKSGSQISGQAIAIDGNTEGLFNWLE